RLYCRTTLYTNVKNSDILHWSMFLRSHKRNNDGKEHRYYSVEESRRLQSGRVVQRRVLYLGEINDSQQAVWRKTLEVFDEQQQRSTTLSLFAEDRPAPADVLDTIQVKLGEMELRRARPYGNCWLGWDTGPSAGIVPAHAAAMERSIRYAVRCVAL